MSRKIKKWLTDSLIYLNLGFWIGIGVGIGFVAIMVIYEL